MATKKSATKTKPAAKPDLRSTVQQASALSTSDPQAALALLAPLAVAYPAESPADHALGSKGAREAMAWGEQLTLLHKTHGFVLAQLGLHTEAVQAYDGGALCGGIESGACALYALELLLDPLDDAAGVIARHRSWAEANGDDADDFDFDRHALLARAYLRAGQLAEAEATYRKIHEQLNAWKTQVDGRRKSDGGESGSAARAKQMAAVRRELEQYAAKHGLEVTAAPILAWLV